MNTGIVDAVVLGRDPRRGGQRGAARGLARPLRRAAPPGGQQVLELAGRLTGMASDPHRAAAGDAQRRPLGDRRACRRRKRRLAMNLSGLARKDLGQARGLTRRRSAPVSSPAAPATASRRLRSAAPAPRRAPGMSAISGAGAGAGSRPPPRRRRLGDRPGRARARAARRGCRALTSGGRSGGNSQASASAAAAAISSPTSRPRQKPRVPGCLAIAVSRPSRRSASSFPLTRSDRRGHV